MKQILLKKLVIWFIKLSITTLFYFKMFDLDCTKIFTVNQSRRYLLNNFRLLMKNLKPKSGEFKFF